MRKHAMENAMDRNAKKKVRWKMRLTHRTFWLQLCYTARQRSNHARWPQEFSSKKVPRPPKDFKSEKALNKVF